MRENPTPPRRPAYLTAAEAAAELGVSRATLYAYVSRGLVRSEPVPGRKQRRYRADDVRRLRSPPEPGEPLSWGQPVLDSAITLIADGRLYYRGRDAAALAGAASVESVARLLWRQDRDDPFAAPPPPPLRAPRPTAGLAPLPRCQALLPLAAAADLRAFNLAPDGVAATGARILRLMTGWLAGPGAGPARAPVERRLRQGWRAPVAAEPVLRAALIMAADHELNASAFAVRVVASTRATPYAAVLAGLAALQGPRHGGQTAQVAALLAGLPAHPDAVAGEVAERLHRGEPLPGFGHPLYPQGDIRADVLFAAAGAAAPGAPSLLRDRAVAAAVHALTGRSMNIDFALVAAARALALPAGAALALFALGRTIGWIAHAQEQYQEPGLIRPRARYTGEPPKPARLDRGAQVPPPGETGREGGRGKRRE